MLTSDNMLPVAGVPFFAALNLLLVTVAEKITQAVDRQDHPRVQSVMATQLALLH